MIRQYGLFIILITMVLLAVSCKRYKDPEALYLGTSQQFESLDSIIAEMSATSYIHGFTNRGLIRFDHEWKITTNICKELPTFENGLAVKYVRNNVLLIKGDGKYKATLDEGKLSQELVEDWNMKLQPYRVVLAADSPVEKTESGWKIKDSGFLEYQVTTNKDGGLEVRGTTNCVKMTFEIKDTAGWGDGSPVIVDDFILTWNVGRDEMVRVGARENYTDILEIEKLSDKKFVVHKKKIDYQYNRLTEDWFKPMPSHIMGNILDKKLDSPEAYEKRTPYTNDPTNPGLYNGPYVVKELELGSHLILERNPHFYGTPAKIKRIIICLIEDTSTLEAYLLSGTIDYIPGEVGNLSLDQGISFEKRHSTRKGYDVVYKSGLIYEHIDMAHENPMFQDRRVRRALMHGMNRKAIIDQVFEGKLTMAHTNISPLDSVYWDEIMKYKYDPEKANKLLEEAGWKMKEDGFRYKNGKMFQFTFMTTAGNKTRELVQQVLQADWRKLGMRVDIKNEPARVYFGKTVKQGSYTGLALFAWISSPENVPKTTMHSINIPSAENGYNGQNSGKYNNPEMDTALVDCELELEFDKRFEHWKKLQKIYAEEVPVLPLYFRADVFILPKWLKNVNPTGNQYASSYDAEKWEIVGRP